MILEERHGIGGISNRVFRNSPFRRVDIDLLRFPQELERIWKQQYLHNPVQFQISPGI